VSIKIAPSLLSADFSDLGKQVEITTQDGADWLHFDVMDGHFVPNITIGPLVVRAVRDRSNIPFDVHLMIDKPERYLEAFAKAGADYIVVHAEATTHLQRTLAHIRDLGKKAGVALNPATPLSSIEWVLDDLDLLLLMTVNPGFGGQKFIPASIRKIEEARKIIDQSGHSIFLQVDGGVNEETVKDVAKAGADVLVAGTAVFRHPQGIAAAINQLKTLADQK
jgi:ribulose-phosphate 3-epimerase